MGKDAMPVVELKQCGILEPLDPLAYTISFHSTQMASKSSEVSEEMVCSRLALACDGISDGI